MGTFPTAFPAAIKETALEFLNQEAARGAGKTEAAKIVAKKFTNGPSVPALMGWATAAGIVFVDKRGASNAAQPTNAAPVERDDDLAAENERLAASNNDLTIENQHLGNRVEELTLANHTLTEENGLLRKLTGHYLSATAS